MNSDYEKHPTENSIPDSTSKPGAKRKRLPGGGTPGRRQQRPEDIPWTAARCNRLLRTIASRIHILRRLSENNFADKAAAKRSPARRKIVFQPDGGRVSPKGVEGVRSRLAGLSALESPVKGGEDPEWFPQTTKKGPARTYGAKARKVKIEEPFEDAVKGSSHADFRSPFIKRILRTDAASPTNPVTDTPRRIAGQKFVLDPKTHAERALRTLLESFDKVLAITTSVTTGRKLGAGSLRDMCLRKVPEYIDYEQKWAYDEAEYDFDATETIYVDLEKLGNGGWNGLRDVVRAHAVKMIADAMDERSWPVESLGRLLDVCERNAAVAEGQQILRSWFLKSEGRAPNRMTKMLAWSKILDCTGFFFRTVREVLECGRLRVQELAECPGIWQDLLRAMARKSSRAEAAHFLEAYALACFRTDNETGSAVGDSKLHDRLKRDEILQNVMVLVTALCWTVDDNTTSSTSGELGLSCHIHRIAIAACQLSSQQVFDPPRKMLRSMEPFLTSSILLHALNLNSSADHLTSNSIETITQNLFAPDTASTERTSGPARAEFVCSTAKCIAHISQTSANGFIKDVSTSLILLAKHTSSNLQPHLKRFAVDIAAAWADYREDNESYAFAEELEKAAFESSPMKEIEHTPGSAQKPGGFRWEEAIGEWIASTPLASAGTEKVECQADVDQVIAKVSRDGDEVRSIEATSGSSSSARSSGPSISPSRSVGHKVKYDDLSPHMHPALSSESTSPTAGGISKPTGIPEQSSDSPTQAKAIRLVAEKCAHDDSNERDELAATPHHKSEMYLAPSADSIKDELAPSTPAQPPQESPRNINLTLRSKPFPQDAMLVDRDELATTPAQAFIPSPEPQSPLTDKKPAGYTHSPTPPKFVPTSTRVLRSTKHKSAPPPPLDPKDELAMTPAQRVLATPRRTRGAKVPAFEILDTEAGAERDELGVTPQLPKTRGKGKRGVKGGAVPLGTRSVNAGTMRQRRKGWEGGSEDELGL